VVSGLWLFRQTLGVRPWLIERPVPGAPGHVSFQVPTAKVGLWVFLAIATSLFVLLVSAYFMRMKEADWNGLVFPSVLWLNTVLLVFSDLAMRSARKATRSGSLAGVKNGMIAAGVFSLAFIAGQLWAWQQLNASGYFAASGAPNIVAASPANGFFYLFTAIHGVHLLGGLWVWGRTTARVWRGADMNRVRLSVDLCTVYWHYLLVIWLVLFALLIPAVSELCRSRLLG